jgi:hypothetical protein
MCGRSPSVSPGGKKNGEDIEEEYNEDFDAGG